MQRSLYEMDIENSINRAKSQGLEEGLNRGKAVGIAEGEAKGKAVGIENLIQSLKDFRIPTLSIKQKLMDLYHLSSTEADTYLKK